MANPFAFLSRPAPNGNVFPKWANAVPWKALVALLLVATAATAGITAWFTPEYLNRGYTPDQPVAFDHSLHVGQLGMDCRYCH
ncbi:MAG: cytochrome c family protein, partial [Puniceicoccales bacterium]|nr:cytochrome c family protein [Puniceicoccales bacterium]